MSFASQLFERRDTKSAAGRVFLLLFITFVFSLVGCNQQNEEKITAPDGYRLAWNEEFNYEGLPNPSIWSYDTSGNAYGWGNNEQQHYTANKKENAFVDGEFLHIIARKDSAGGKAYTSARLTTKNKADWKYGRLEVRAKIPGGRGLWPAIWMLPTDWEYGGWPKSGEIDIMEHVGYNPDSVFASAHTDAYNHVEGTNKTEGIKVDGLYDQFNTFTLEWGPEAYHVYFNDEKFFSFRNENKTYAEWPFDKKFHLLLNVAVGGNWGGKEGIDNSIFPKEMLVDYVRMFKKK